MAHVEAPTFGSIILAGVLLKLGGVGLVRFLCVMNTFFMKSCLLGYLMVFSIYVTVLCGLQRDFKRLVAYSSVSHMMLIPILILGSRFISLKGLLLVSFMHGLRSPVMFMLVGFVYVSSSSRQLLLVRGLLLVNPLLSFLMVVAFFFTISAPPFPSFVGEVFTMISRFYLSRFFWGGIFVLSVFFYCLQSSLII